MAAELLDSGLSSSVTVWSRKWSWGWLIQGPGYERPSHYGDSRETEIFQRRSRLEPLLKVHTSPCLFIWIQVHTGWTVTLMRSPGATGGRRRGLAVVSDCLSPLASEHTLSFGVMDTFTLSQSALALSPFIWQSYAVFVLEGIGPAALSIWGLHRHMERAHSGHLLSVSLCLWHPPLMSRGPVRTRV